MTDELLYEKEDAPEFDGKRFNGFGHCSVCNARTLGLRNTLCSYHGGRTANEIMNMPSAIDETS